MRAASVLPLLAFPLTGCTAAQGPFPSLAPRPIERELAQERPVQPAPEVPDDAALAQRIAALTGEARQGDAAFQTALAEAQRAAGGAGAAGSEGWIAAQMGITRAEAARAPTVRALADLDRLGIEKARQPTSMRDREALTAAVAEVQAMADRQHQRLDALRTSLSPA
jgi:hypothetical protein